MFGISDYPTFVGAVIIFLAIPGPGNLALLTSTAQAGLRGGLVAALGIMAGDQVLMWAAVAGLSALLLASPMLFGVIQWLGALYLAYLGVRMVTAKPGNAPLLDMSSGRFFRQSFFITLLNPKAIVFYLAFFPLFIDPVQHQGLLTFGVMALTIAALTFLYGLGAVLLTHFLAERVRANPRMSALLEKGAGIFLIGFGVKLALSR